MTRQTMDYLLRLAIQHRDEAARDMVESGMPSPAWGEAAAVKELLEPAGGVKPAEEMSMDRMTQVMLMNARKTALARYHYLDYAKKNSVEAAVITQLEEEYQSALATVAAWERMA